MARIAAVLRLLAKLSAREVKSLSSVGLNNLFFCAVFLMLGGGARAAFQSTLLFQFLLIVPILIALSIDTLGRLPAQRLAVWPVTGLDRLAIRTGSMILNPAFWLFGGGMWIAGGAGAGVVFLGLAVVAQMLVGVGSSVIGHWQLGTPVPFPRLPGRFGGISQIALRQIVSTLDFCAALLLCAAGSAYRWLAPSPQPEAFPILSVIVAIALSTFAQRSFGLDTPGSMARYRLMPVAGWQLLLARDAAYLFVSALLVAPLGFRAGMTFSLMALAVGRYPSLWLNVPQRRLRFTGGDLRFGIAQILVGGVLSIASARSSLWYSVGGFAGWICSLYAGNRWWNRRGGRG